MWVAHFDLATAVLPFQADSRHLVFAESINPLSSPVRRRLLYPFSDEEFGAHHGCDVTFPQSHSK